MSRARSIRVGCSGWQYPHWRGAFYPREVPTHAWLAEYARTFDTVEINASFYRLPAPDAAARWRRAVPRAFLFAWKASRFITHMKKLKDPEEPIARMMTSARALGAKLGALLFQLPPRWVPDEARLDAFLRALPAKPRAALELRDPDGYAPWLIARLARARVALVVHDMEGSASPRVRTAPLVYVRCHGPQRYGGAYPARAIADWAAWTCEMRDAGADVLVYFNNDREAKAPRDAARLRDAIARRA